MRYLLTSVGIEVTNEKAFAEIQSKEIKVNDILTQGKVRNVYFSKFIIQ